MFVILAFVQNFFPTIRAAVVTQVSREEGQGLVEYALILIFVSVVLVFLLTVLGPGIANIYSNILVAVNGAGSG